MAYLGAVVNAELRDSEWILYVRHVAMKILKVR